MKNSGHATTTFAARAAEPVLDVAPTDEVHRPRPGDPDDEDDDDRPVPAAAPALTMAAPARLDRLRPGPAWDTAPGDPAG